MMKRRWIAFLLVLLLLIPSAALAEETQPSSKTVYFTLSNDGVPVLGADGETVLTHVKVTVPYFDLGSYGLSDFYRYEAASFEEGGGYIGDEVIQQPTVLHLYIYMLEKYCLGLDDSECMNGSSDLLNQTPNAVMDCNGNDITGGMKALNITGSSCSMYMQQFWGHDENLMYYINHQYPLQAAGWGSTADYILLEDGMTVDVAMFTDWSFWNDGGAFGFFDRDEYYVQAGASVEFSVLKTETIACEDGSSYESKPLENVDVKLYDATGTEEIDWIGTTDASGVVRYTFEQSKVTPGDYMLMGLDQNLGTSDARYAPATAIVHVVESLEPLTGVTLDRTSCELAPAEPLKLIATVTPENAAGLTYQWTSSNEEVAHVSDIGVVKTFQGGEADITCTVTDAAGNSFSATCHVTVRESVSVESVTLDRKLTELRVGDTLKLNQTVFPENASQKSCQWKSSDLSIVHVDHLGNLTAKANGVATITVTTDDGSKTAVCRVAVGKKFGDVNSDGKIDTTDAMYILQFTIGKAPEDMDAEVADTNGDGVTDTTDAMLILQYAVGMISEFEQ